MSIIVTGGASFIGSCVVRALNDAGEDDIVVVDDIAQTEKWVNLRNKRYAEYIHKSSLAEKLSEMGGIRRYPPGRLLLDDGA